MKNRYEVKGDITVIHLNKGLKTIIDTVDLPIADSFPNTWVGCKKGKKMYVEGKVRQGSKYKGVILHRLLMGDPEGLVIDHDNHDSLDNRRSTNLKAVTNADNVRRRKGANSNSRTGIRGVSLDVNGKYKVRVTIEGKVKQIGTYETLAEAKTVVEKYRKDNEL